MFEIDPGDIANFDGLKTVELLRRLVYAEAKTAGVAPFHVSAPMQITLADGGVDVSVSWTGGASSTDYFPHRDIIFQCKASDGKGAAWAKETWTKASQAKGKARVLNAALTAGVNRGAAYIGVTTVGLVGAKPEDREAAIADGIRQTGHDPTLLQTIKLYDGNKLADWASRHEAVALWVKEQQAGMSLRSFQTVEKWRGRVSASAPEYVPGSSARFIIGDTTGSGLTFDQFSSRLVTHLSEPDARSVRITGSSGVGKSRSVFEGLTRLGLGEHPTAASVIFCDRREAGEKLWDVTTALAARGTPLILFVDECPRTDALKLHKLASTAGSELRIITVDTDPKSLAESGCLDVRVQATDDDVIEGILAQLLPDSTSAERQFIADLCAGFPSIAVLAARADSEEAIFRSVADVASRILRGAGLTDLEQIRALACLSMFDHLAPEQSVSDFNNVAETLGRLDGDAMYEHLIDAVEPGLVGRYSGTLSAQPRPIANHLALHRLERLRPAVIQQFLDCAPLAQRAAMLSRVRYLSRSPTLRSVAHLMFGQGGSIAAAADLLTERGAAFCAAFVHVDPNYVGRSIHYAVVDTTIDGLSKVTNDLRELVGALRRLVFRLPTFRYALKDLLRLSAAEYPAGGTATEAVNELFHLRLSGTEASSKTRFAVLDEFAEEDDLRVRRAVVAALDTALDRTGGFRIAGYEELGDALPAKDWAFKTTEEALQHYKSALDRLSVLRKHRDVADAAESAVAHHMRQLMITGLMDAVTAFASEVKADRGFWAEAAKGVGDWLYFDRDDPASDLALEVRRLYEMLLPTDPVDRVILFCQFWPADFRDPDLIYRTDGASADFEYAARQAALLAPDIAADPALLDRAIDRMASREVRHASPFTDALVGLIPDRRAVFVKALAVSDASDGGGLSFVQSLLRSIDRADAALGSELEEMAASSKTFEGKEIAIFLALRVTNARLATIAQRVTSGVISPQQAVPLSYGQGMDPFPVVAIRPIFDALINRAPDGGVWAAIEMLSMYIHGKSKFDSALYDLIKMVLNAPLGDENGGGTMSSHSYGTLVSLLSRADKIDEDFAQAFVRQLIAQIQSRTASYRSQAGEAMQEALATIVAAAPLAVWEPLAEFYEGATPAERDRLSRMVSRRSPFGEAVNSFREGVLFTVPLDVLVHWADKAPDRRVGFLVSFFPILETQRDTIRWHPALSSLADQFGNTKAFRSALVDRISPTSWGGSLAPYLEPYLEPLQAWNQHPLLDDWAEDIREMLVRRLKDDAEMVASWR